MKSRRVTVELGVETDLPLGRLRKAAEWGRTGREEDARVKVLEARANVIREKAEP